MKTGENAFDLILEELLHQKRLLEDLEAENRELRRQLADLQEGRGIFIEIFGTRFPLTGDSVVASSDVVSSSQVPPAVEQTSTNADEALPVSTIETPLPDVDQEQEGVPSPAFLEELLLDELVSSAATPVADWQGATTPLTPVPATSKQPTAINEDEKAALRRELMGSFLLE